MDDFEKEVALQSYNTFGIQAHAHYFLRLKSLTQLKQLFRIADTQPFYLGGGSNIILSESILTRPIIKNELKGIRIIKSDQYTVFVEVAAGENWHEWVNYSLHNKWYGLENLSLIPGTVGACPIQNIGAYGVEVSNYIDHVTCIDLNQKHLFPLIFSHQDCQFAYRHSLFKMQPHLLITSVQFRLFKIPQVITNYGTISQQLKKMGILNRVPTPREVADAIIALRRQLLPDFIKIGNVGSFFKNPVVSAKKAQELLKLYPTLPTYPIQENQIKLSAAWLIDHAQLKGFRINDVAVDKHHALVLVNLGQARGEDVKKLAQAIQTIILKQYRIGLEIEPIFVTNAIQIR